MISVGNNKAVICKGDFHPAQFYKGDKKIAGYTVESFESENGVTLENCYNDKLHNAQIFGNSIQDGTPTPENPIEVQSVGELVTEGEYAGKYKIPVRVRGKNLLNQEHLQNVTGNINAGLSSWVYLQNATNRFGYKLPIEEEGTYCISVKSLISTGNEDFWCSIYKFPKGSVVNGSSAGAIIGEPLRIKTYTKTFVVEEGYDYYIWTNRSGYTTYPLHSAENFIDWQLEYGNTATPFEPYIEPQTFNTYLDEPLRKVGEFADYIDFGDKKVIRKNKAIKKLGSNIFTQYGNVVVCGDSLSPIGVGTTIDRYAVMCSYDSKVEFSNISGTKVAFYLDVNGIDYTSETAMEEWTQLYNSWIESGKFLLQYALNTPIEEPIELPELPTFKGTTIYEIDTQIPATISGKYKKVEV